MKVAQTTVRPIDDHQVDVSLSCPWCSVVSTSKSTMSHRVSQLVFMLATCQVHTCNRVCLLVAHDPANHMNSRYRNETFSPKVYPSTTITYERDGVPKSIARDFSEALNCFLAGHNYAGALVGRRVLQAAARDVLGAERPSLQKEIDAIPDTTLSAALKEAAHEVRLVGNDAAHADEVDTHDVGHLLDFVGEVLEALYVTPAKVKALKAKRKAGGTTPATGES